MQDMGTITRRMESAFNGLQHEFKSLYVRKDFEIKISELYAASKSERPSKLNELFKMFKICDIDYEEDKDDEYYRKLVENADIPSPIEVENTALYMLFKSYQKYPSPENYMLRLVNSLCFEKDGWNNDTLRLRILKQFIKYGNSLTYVVKKMDAAGNSKSENIVIYGGKGYIKKYLKAHGCKEKDILDGISKIEDDVFSVLNNATKAQKKPSGPYGLLKICDDLAKGNFRTGGGTKKSLYLFAMVYDMTYYTGKKSEKTILYDKTDIETNLFRDYYTNNLLRFLSESYKEELDGLEVDPVGIGINYKNYAEMVYLYYISKREMTPCEKIKSSHLMIKAVTEAQKQKKNKKELQLKISAGTVFHRNLFSEDILDLSEDEFMDFLCENYNCNPTNGKSTIGEMQVETEQKTAFQNYEKLINELIKVLMKREGMRDVSDYDYTKRSEEEKKEDREKWLSKCNYGLWFTDVAAFGKDSCENKRTDLIKKVYGMLSEDEKKTFSEKSVDDFVTVLFAINKFMGYTVNEKESKQTEEQEWTETSQAKTKALFVDSEDKITRTSIIVAYYYYYNAIHEEDYSDKLKNFEKLFNNMAEGDSSHKGLNRYLEDSFYQKLSGRDIFDILVAFSSYSYIHDLMF